VRVAQQLARQEHRIGLAIRDDLFRLFRRGDEADGAGRDADFAA